VPDIDESPDPAQDPAARTGGKSLTDQLGLGEQSRDHVTLLSGTAQNIVGLAVFVVGTFAANVLVSRHFGGGDSGAAALAVVTLGTQFAWIAAAGTRFGMDMAAVRYVAIDAGADRGGRARGTVAHAVVLAAAISLVFGVLTFVLAGPLGSALSDQESAVGAMRAAALALPFVAATFVWLGGSRGLKIMRHTLYIQWVAQPILWIILMIVFWRFENTIAMAVWAYAASWVLCAGAARFLWEREVRRRYEPQPTEPGITDKLFRYGAPRAPAALLSQGLFWIDYFVASLFISKGYVTTDELGVYSACVRVALAMVLFLTAVAYVFSPFVADLHARGEREKLDGLFKAITRWTVTGTIPILLLMLIVPGPILQIFGGSEFETGVGALRILLVGQAVNVSVGAAGFVLIMAGRTGWDLTVYGLSALLDVIAAIILIPLFGIEGAALAQTITIAASNALRLWLVYRFVGIHPYNRHYFRLLIPAAIGGAVMLATHVALASSAWQIDLLGTAAVGGLAYGVGVLLFGLTPAEKRTIRGVIEQRRGRGTAPRADAAGSA
jgi:O-antigen/teichoic acid export membrane protein